MTSDRRAITYSTHGQKVDMHSTVQLNSGSQMPVIGLGTWKMMDDTANRIEHALQFGYTMIDTSGDYETQPGIAEGIHKSGLERERLFLVSKIEETEDAYAATTKNLVELNVDYVDLMLIHRPPEDSAGVELWRGLQRAQREGLVRDIGVSNYSESKMTRLAEHTGQMPVVNQIEWSPFSYSLKMVEYCADQDIIIQSYSPLTRGERLDNQTLQAIAEKHSKSPAQILIRWNIDCGFVPIVKAAKVEHMQEDIDVFDFTLDEEDLRRLAGLNEQYSALGDKPVYLKHRKKKEV